MWLDPSLAPGVLFCDVGCQNGLPSTGVNRNEGGLRCLLANINRMEVPLYREEPRPPRDGGDNGFIISPTHML